MQEIIKVGDVYDKNLNFLIGSGASAGLFPTLALSIKDGEGASQTVETLAALFDDDPGLGKLTPLFMHYYESCIKPALEFSLDTLTGVDEITVANNYEQFVKTILALLQRRKQLDRRANVFTTNYDGCFEHTADRLLQSGTIDFVLNDGARGFRRRFVQARNFNTFLCQTGIFERTQIGIPQINLIHLHGSVYWSKGISGIQVDYSRAPAPPLIDAETLAKLAPFSACLVDETKSLLDLPSISLAEEEVKEFWSKYEELPIVNPTRWKFHQTVFEEHYYQMLRLLSYELEKPNAVLICFGFSFADQHILNLVKRSLSNPSLQVFVCCYSNHSLARMTAEFSSYRSVTCIGPENGCLDFTRFNQAIFSTSPTPESSPDVAAAEPEST